MSPPSHGAASVHPPPLTPWQPAVCLSSPWAYLFWLFPVHGILQYVTFSSGFFHLAKRDGGFSTSQYFIPFNGWITFHGMDLLHQVYPFA